MQLAAYLESKYLGQTVLDDLNIIPFHAVKAIAKFFAVTNESAPSTVYNLCNSTTSTFIPEWL